MLLLLDPGPSNPRLIPTLVIISQFSFHPAREVPLSRRGCHENHHHVIWSRGIALQAFVVVPFRAPPPTPPILVSRLRLIPGTEAILRDIYIFRDKIRVYTYAKGTSFLACF